MTIENILFCSLLYLYKQQELKTVFKNGLGTSVKLQNTLMLVCMVKTPFGCSWHWKGSTTAVQSTMKKSTDSDPSVSASLVV